MPVPSAVTCLGLFFTTTPLSPFFASFLAIAGLGFATIEDADAETESEAVFAALVRAATALEIKEGTCKIKAKTLEIHPLFEVFYFFTILFFA